MSENIGNETKKKIGGPLVMNSPLPDCKFENLIGKLELQGLGKRLRQGSNKKLGDQKDWGALVTNSKSSGPQGGLLSTSKLQSKAGSLNNFGKDNDLEALITNFDREIIQK